MVVCGVDRDLEGRCGTCGFFIPIKEDENGVEGDCRLGCWMSPLKDTATCAHHKPIGQSFEGALKTKRAAGQRRARSSTEPEERKRIPRELGIDMEQEEFRQVLREVLLDELGVRDTQIGERWQGGILVMKPGKEDTQSKEVPLDVFFRKIVSVREKLRMIEQKINSNKALAHDDKIQLQQYVTQAYGALTTFNVLFRDKADQFSGQSSKS